MATSSFVKRCFPRRHGGDNHAQYSRVTGSFVKINVVGGCVRAHPVAIHVEYFARRQDGVIRSHPATTLLTVALLLPSCFDSG
uniref:(California timema) hypothetical protein n=1 Tax=Timema californicum TaxID=61474 RepID=A0A7R9J6P4_TIMCA|nr:unnamed protein product [Timema californicum]